MKEYYQKALEKSNLFFLVKSFPYNGQNYEKQKQPGTIDLSLFRLQKKLEKFLCEWFITWPSLMITYKTVFELFQKSHLLSHVSQQGMIQKFNLGVGSHMSITL